MDTGLLVLPVIVGGSLVGHWVPSLFGWFGGGGLTATAWCFRSVGYRRPRLEARLAGGAGLVGGAALAVGLGTPLALAGIIAVMLNAAVAVYRRNGRFAIDGGYGYPLGMAAVAVTLGFTGVGAVPLNAALGSGDGGVASGLLTLALGLAAFSAVLLNSPRWPPLRGT